MSERLEAPRLLNYNQQAAQAAFAQDVAAGLAKPGSAPVASTSTAPRKPVPKPSNPFANYSTAESLGYQDPDAEQYAAEAERRRTQGIAGDWEILAPPVTLLTTTSTVDGSESENTGRNLKREAEMPIDEEDTRQFKLRKKTVTLGEIYDPGLIPIKIKKKEELVEPVLPHSLLAPSQGTSTATNAPKWTTVQWKRPGDTVQDENEEETPAPPEPPVKSEAVTMPDEQDVKPPNAATELLIEKSTVKTEDPMSAPAETAPLSGGMFRKRKVPVGGTRGRRAL